MDFLNFNSVKNVPGIEARAAFTVSSSSVFKVIGSTLAQQEHVEIVPTIIDDTLSYVPWGGDNLMPFTVLDLFEKDETLSTCQVFNAEICYGSGLRYDTCVASQSVRDEVEDFTLDNDLAAYFLGVSQDFKHGSFNTRQLVDIVNFIWERNEDFEEWHNSETAKLFAPPIFRNKKNAAGYFF